MATGSDQAAGYGMVSLALAIFSYYTVWVVILPFVDNAHPVHNYFLPQTYAIMVPVVAGVLALIGLGVFIGIVSMKNQKTKSKAS